LRIYENYLDIKGSAHKKTCIHELLEWKKVQKQQSLLQQSDNNNDDNKDEDDNKDDDEDDEEEENESSCSSSSSERYDCEDCEKSYSTSTGLYQHRYIKHNPKK
jgi:hypothetical protein